MRAHDGQFAFDRFRLDPAERILFDGDVPLRLREKIFETLLFLVRNPGRLLTKEELIDAIWPDHHVEESNLNHNISVLRKTLGDSTDAPQFIETVPKHGFRFIAEVRRITAEPAAVPNEKPVRPSPGRLPLAWAAAAAIAFLLLTAAAWQFATRRGSNASRTVTVLPFDSLGSGNHSYIASSLTETLTNRLGAIGGVSVRPGDSQHDGSDLRAIARRLGVDLVVRGAVQAPSARTIRITAEVYDAEQDANVWSKQFDIVASDILLVEDSIATAIGDQIRPGLTAEERAKLAPAHSNDAAAIEEYLRGRDLLDRRVALPESEQHLENAVRRDPQFAAAWAALAEARMYPRLGGADIEGALAAASRALHLDASLAEAHAAVGFIDFFYRWDWSGAERELRTAIHLNPGYARAHDWFALTLAVKGEMNSALSELAIARRIDPQSLDMGNDAALLHLLAHDFRGTERAAREVLAIDPSSTQARSYLIAALVQLKRFDEAIAETSAQTEATPLRTVSLEVVKWQCGREVDRNAIVAELERLENADVPPEQLAALYARIGEREKSLQFLERACDRHSFGVVFAARNIDLENVRGDPRFSALLRRLGVISARPIVATVLPGREAS